LSFCEDREAAEDDVEFGADFDATRHLTASRETTE